MATTNRYAKRLMLIDNLIKLGYNVTSQKESPRKKTYLIKSHNEIYRLEFDKDWLAINQDKDKLFCGINLLSGKKLVSCMDNDLTKLFNDVVTILYKKSNIKTPTIIL
jgi:hypothetical protein